MESVEVEQGVGIDEGAIDPPEKDSFCHIESGDGRTHYCGKPMSGETTCKMYQGEAICPTCGLPTCPTCAVMSSLADRLIEGDEA